MAEELRVLIVDDEIAVCNSCMKTLSREGYAVDYSLSGEEALNKIAIGNYDLVITDLKMPKVDGMQLLRTVKGRWPEVNVIMITGYGTIRSAVEAMKLGAFDYVSKPFTSEELAGVAARALGLTTIHREKEAPILYLPTIFGDLKIEDLESMWCIPEHAWIMICKDRTVRIGLDAVYRRLIGSEISAIELPRVGKHLKQGEACVVMTAKGTIDKESLKEARHNLWCPLGGIVVETNNEVQKDLSLLARGPYSRGWLVRLEPSNLEEDLRNLKPFTESIGGRAAQKHLKKRI
jgi:CheY-like chemotaxis protein